eukprot:Transcript_2470.p1 GENE.Transcript_2470~~Transcript_2470.p1  ORF type:complete len:763 (-),score=372.96 Transcript_2470:127-2292(-)
MELTIAKCPDQKMALTNCVYLSPSDLERLGGSAEEVYLEIKGFVFTARATREVESNTIGVNSIHRRMLGSNGDPVTVSVFSPGASESVGLAAATIECDYLQKVKARGDEKVDGEELVRSIVSRLSSQFLTVRQHIAMDYRGDNLLLTVTSLEAAGGEPGASMRGILVSSSEVLPQKAPGSLMVISGLASASAAKTNIFRAEFNFEKMGIGGLDKEFSDIFRRAFASRVVPASIIAKLGTPHVKGMLLYGPPGTGKTLIARQIGKMLNGKEPKIVNGPEILSKYVGQSEENIRALFSDAEAEYKERGDDSELHIIIFDEIDSICKQRGSSRDGTGVHDTVVNQLLSKIDGVDSLNNILIIGMTNRKDMMDEALLRPGRLEVQVQISLPDESGRLQILKIHTNKMSEAGYLDEGVDLPELAAGSKNFSGAEIEGLVKSASSYALARTTGGGDNLKKIDLSALKVMREDFLRGLTEVLPAFGVSSEDLQACVRGGILEAGEACSRLKATATNLISQLHSSKTTSLLSVLLEGPPGTGKTALAAQLALDSRCAFCKLVSPNTMIGMNETSKAQLIAKTFDDAHKSPMSLVVLDDIERLLEYVRIGPRFSNIVLQTLLVCVKKQPRAGHKLVVLGTSSSAAVLEQLELLDVFNVALHVPPLTPVEATATLGQLGVPNVADVSGVLAGVREAIPVKKLLLVVEMSLDASGRIDAARFAATLQEAGIL